MPTCPEGSHVGKVSNLFGGVATPATPDTCLPDTEDNFWNPLRILNTALNVISPLTSFPVIQPSAINTGLSTVEDALDLSKQERQYIDLGIQAVQTVVTSGADTMGFFDDFGLDAVVDWSSDILDSVDFGDVASFGLDVAQTFLPQQTYGGGAVAVPVMAKAPQIAGAIGGAAAGAIAKVGPTVGRKFFNKWPNLAVAIQKMRNAGQNVSRSKLYSMLKRFGPEFLVTAGIMSAAAVSELALAGPGHRRMNPANSKALRRSMRRIKSFHRLCSHADVLRTHRRAPSRCAKKC